MKFYSNPLKNDYIAIHKFQVMKKIYLFLFYFVLSFSLSGQTDEWFFSLNLGGSWPLGAFAKNTSTDQNGGFAGKGFSLSLDANRPVSDNLAFKGMALLNNNPVNRNWMVTNLVSRMSQYFPFDSKDQQFLSMTVNPWVSNGLLIGTVYTITFDKFLWDIQALGGLNVAYLPQEKLLYQNPANNWIYLHRNTNSVSFSYGLLAGTALRFPISEKVYLRVGFDYYNSRATINYEEQKVTKDESAIHVDQLGAGKSVVPIETISGTIGFVYYLN